MQSELLKSTNQYITGQIQALVPEMRFNCSGKITSWKIAVPQQNFNTSIEPIKLQVWRHTSNNIYRLVGSNSVFHDQTEMPKVVTQNVSANDQIIFKTGDIVGFHINMDKYRLLIDSTNNSKDILYTPSVSNRQLCTFNTTCDQIIRIKRNFLPQLLIHYGKQSVCLIL